LKDLTAPEVKQVSRPLGGMGLGCSSEIAYSLDTAPPVTVLQEKRVAGFNAAVLEAESADSLVTWLKEHDYAYSPEIAAWAKPYVESGWKITALKVAKDDKASKGVAARALRISFHTDRPLFPYREPDPKHDAAALHAKHRLLRIYFVAESRYRGELTKDTPWTGHVVWSNPLPDKDRHVLLQRLSLPESTGPARWWLTEFEDDWPYRAAPADLYFSVDREQRSVKRPPILVYVHATLPNDASGYGLAAALILPPLWRRVRRGRQN
jgi:hypothetical protein